jgi:hypothetical protein
MRSDLQWQFEYRGNTLQNIRILVCCDCLDIPHFAFYPVKLPPDPLPVINPRIEPLAQEEAGLTRGIPII